MNPLLNQLQPYPFERLRSLMKGIEPNPDYSPILLHIGEPKHETPQVVLDAFQSSAPSLAQYPATAGLPELRQSCARWLSRRYGIYPKPEKHILPVNGSREALFSFVQCVLNNHRKPALVLSPNPFYQIYEGATILAGGSMVFANTDAPDFLPKWSDIPESTWRDIQLVFVCTPGNPTGAVMDLFDWAELFDLQDQYGFVIASDECYGELYFDRAPLGILEAADRLQRGWTNKMMFTSLSKRSNVPSLRSGFVAGDDALISAFLLYRTYHGCAMSLPVQYASVAAWDDEVHVEKNRALYREKFDRVLPLLQEVYQVQKPDASFYLWLPVPDGDDLAFTQALWAKASIQVLPGSFMGRETDKTNAGKGYVRLALVAPISECLEAAERMVALGS